VDIGIIDTPLYLPNIASLGPYTNGPSASAKCLSVTKISTADISVGNWKEV
jgi:hypothetical protein